MSALENKNIETAILGGGCFWCVEAVYLEIDGIESVISGYAGGHIKNPAYREVCMGITGHAEVIQIQYDATKISYDEILQIFWHGHDPTTPNRQGHDVGTQYRSIILYHDESQRQIAEASIEKTNQTDLWPNPIVTEVLPLDVFYRAEADHQNYYRQNQEQPYCSIVIGPKVAKIRKAFQGRLKQ